MSTFFREQLNKMQLDTTLFSFEMRDDKREYLHQIVIADQKKCFLQLVVEETLVTLIVNSQFFMNDEEGGECCGCFSRWRRGPLSSSEYSPVTKSDSSMSISIRHNVASAEEKRKQQTVTTNNGELVLTLGTEQEWYFKLGTKQEFYERHVCPKTQQCSFLVTIHRRA